MYTTLAGLWRNGNWQIPNTRSEKQLLLQVYLSTLSINTNPDTYSWWIDDNHKDGNSISTIYSVVRVHEPIIPWSKVVWCSGGIRKHSFITWLMVLNRCPTRDRIIGWGLQTNPLCLLCGLKNETRDHLYFMCQYSWTVWSRASQRCAETPIPDWNVSLQTLCNIRGSKIKRNLLRIAWQASIYVLWAERNTGFIVNHANHRTSFSRKWIK